MTPAEDRADFLKRWEAQCKEWDEIRDELVSAELAAARRENRSSRGVSAYEITTEQKRRVFARGDRARYIDAAEVERVNGLPRC